MYGECCYERELAEARRRVFSMVQVPWRVALRCNLGRFRPQYREQIVDVLDLDEDGSLCCSLVASMLLTSQGPNISVVPRVRARSRSHRTPATEVGAHG